MDEDSAVELHHIKKVYKKVFDKIEENGESMQSVKNIAHVHLLKGFKYGRGVA